MIVDGLSIGYRIEAKLHGLSHLQSGSKDNAILKSTSVS